MHPQNRRDEVYDFYEKAFGPAFGEVADGADLQPSPDGYVFAFTGIVRQNLRGPATTCVCLLSLDTGEMVRLTDGLESAFGARWAPQGSWLAFLRRPGPSEPVQACLVRPRQPYDIRSITGVTGSVEFLSWSPDGTRLLLGVAPYGADVAGAAGSGGVGAPPNMRWRPRIEPDSDRRGLTIVEVEKGLTWSLDLSGLTVWEACFAGPDRVVAIVSECPGEDGWYGSHLVRIDLTNGQVYELYSPPAWRSVPQQLAMPVCGSASSAIAVVQGVCSDRGVVAGDLVLIDPESGASRTVVASADVTHVWWVDNLRALFTGLRGMHSVIGEVSSTNGSAVELWSGPDALGGESWYPAIAADRDGRVYALREQYARPSSIARWDGSGFVDLHDFGHEGSRFVTTRTGRLDPFIWSAPDGTTLEAMLMRPAGSGPHPLVVLLHGGPVGVSLPSWALRTPGPGLLVDRGYAVFCPNPRGSSGRGVGFVAKLVGGMGGVDAADVMSGIDALVEAGLADPARIGVTGASYGGYLTAWLVSQHECFAAAVVVAPITDWASFRLSSNISRFATIFLGRGNACDPLTHAAKIVTPTLTIVGERDLCTPPDQGVRFHRAIAAAGHTATALVSYPEVGHVPRDFPELGDFLARMLDWFGRYLPIGA